MKKPDWLVLCARIALLIYGALLMAASLADLSEVAIQTNDKLLHFLAYLGFTGLAFLASRERRQLFAICITLLLYGLLIEGLQHLTPTRTFSLADAAANTGGISLGLLLSLAVDQIGRHLR